jgi:hypothetical protein
LYRSIDFGKSWTLVPGSTAATAPCTSGAGTCSVALGRSIGAIAVDPADANHIFIGTDVARHGSSSVNGGRFTPPGGAKVGLYESTDGGARFSPALILTQDTVDPSSATGGDFFRGGASNIQSYRGSGETQVYASFFDYGIFRRSQTQDGDTAFHQAFMSAGGGLIGNSSTARTEFSLAPNGGSLRVYVGNTGSGSTADFYRVNDANVSAATLFTGGTNGGWTKLSNATNGTSRLRVAQLLPDPVLVRHAGLLAAGRTEHRLHRRRHAVRRDWRALERPRGPALRRCRRALYWHHAVTTRLLTRQDMRMNAYLHKWLGPVRDLRTSASKLGTFINSGVCADDSVGGPVCDLRIGTAKLSTFIQLGGSFREHESRCEECYQESNNQNCSLHFAPSFSIETKMAEISCMIISVFSRRPSGCPR